jgi:hypothetical protein
MPPHYDFTLKGRRHLAEPYHFTASGLPNVYLHNGVRIERDPDYGELVTVDHLPDLIMAIAFTLVAKPERLTGAEMRLPHANAWVRPKAISPGSCGSASRP